MRWKPRRNGGNNNQTRFHQSVESRDRDGRGSRSFAGHHSWAKSRGGGNKTGATSHAPKEWGSKARKEEEHLTGLAKRAEVDAIREGLEELAEAETEATRDPYEDYDPFNFEDRILNDALLLDLGPDVLFNGQSYFYDDGDFYDYLYDDDECPHCGRRY